jgi:hypothetical protein
VKRAIYLIADEMEYLYSHNSASRFHNRGQVVVNGAGSPACLPIHALAARRELRVAHTLSAVGIVVSVYLNIIAIRSA